MQVTYGVQVLVDAVVGTTAHRLGHVEKPARVFAVVGLFVEKKGLVLGRTQIIYCTKIVLRATCDWTQRLMKAEKISRRWS